MPTMTHTGWHARATLARARVACGLLLAGACLPASAAAGGDRAGFDCAKAANPTERAICADPVLRGMDRELTAAWTRARTASSDRNALDADQRGWLRQRNQDCGADTTCLRGRYTLRIAALRAAPARFSWSGTWERLGGPGTGATLALSPGKQSHVDVAIDAGNGGNSGAFSARGVPAGNALVVRYQDACTLTLRRVDHQIQVEQDGGDAQCGAGAGVFFGGRYVRAGNPMPDWNLVTLGVLPTAAEDAAVRRLLGATDYDALMDRANQVMPDDKTPGLTTFGVRGLYTSMEAALLRHPNGRVQVAILDDELRYYSSDPAWTARLPPAFGPWLSRFTRTVRFMSAPGRPTTEITRKDD